MMRFSKHERPEGRRADDDVELTDWEVESLDGQTRRWRALRRTLVESLTPLVWVALGAGVIAGGSVGFALGFYGGLRAQLGPPALVPTQESSPSATVEDGFDGGVATSAAVEPGIETAPVVSAPQIAAPSRPAPKSRRSRSPAPVVAPAVPVVATSSAPPAASSTLTLRATGASAAQAGIQADIFIDGVRAGRAPLQYHPVQPGTHRVRFDCIFEGRTFRGTDTVLDVPPDTDAVVEHKCDVLVYLGVPN